MTGVLVWATVVGLFLRVPMWAGVFLCSLTGASFLFYLVSYVYLLINDRESLRRERIEMKDEHALQAGSVGVDSSAVDRRPQVFDRSRKGDG